MNRMSRTAVKAGAAVLGLAALGLAAAPALGAGAATPAATAPSLSQSLSAAVPGAKTGALHQWAAAHRRAILRAVVVTSAKAIGVTPEALVADLRAGHSVAQVAAEHHVATAKVVGALVARGDAAVNRRVEKSKLTAAQAAKIRAALPRIAERIVGHQFHPKG